MIQLKHTFSPFLELLSFKRAHPRGYVKLRETSLSPKFCSSFSDRHGKIKTNQPAPFPPKFSSWSRLFGATQLLINLSPTVTVVHKRVMRHCSLFLGLPPRTFFPLRANKTASNLTTLAFRDHTARLHSLRFQ